MLCADASPDEHKRDNKRRTKPIVAIAKCRRPRELFGGCDTHREAAK
jgi:hypothetical protein